MYEEGAVTDRMCQKWFAKFRAGDFSLDDAPRLGRPVEVDSDQIKTLNEYNQRYTMQEIINILKTARSIELLVKMKNVPFILWKQHNELFGQPNTCQSPSSHLRNESEQLFVKFRAGDFSLDDAPQLGRRVEVDSDQIETLIENNQHYTTWEIADILKIPRSTELLVKMKNVSFSLWKKPPGLFGQPSSISLVLGLHIKRNCP